MSNPGSTQFEPTEVPSRIADLGFTYLRPVDFRALDLPEEAPKFEEPTYFLPLHVCMASYGAVVFSVAARPAYDSGSVEDWMMYLAEQQLGEVKSMRRGVIGGMQAMVAEAVQPSEAGRMRFLAHFIEDGGRLIIVSVMAPEQVWSSVEEMLRMMTMSFRLSTVKGQSAPVTREEAAKRARLEEKAPEVKEAVEEPKGAEEKEEDDVNRPTEMAEVALADNADSLSDENAMNARLRDNGVGMVPRILEVNEKGRYAKLGAGAIESTFLVPLGWHVIDDGKRTLVFDADGKVQLNLSLRPASGSSELLDSLLQEHLEQQPDIEHLRLELGGMECLALRNYRVEDEVLEQAFLCKEVSRKNMLLVARVTAASEDMVRAMNVAEVVLRDLKHGGR